MSRNRSASSDPSQLENPPEEPTMTEPPSSPLFSNPTSPTLTDPWSQPASSSESLDTSPSDELDADTGSKPRSTGRAKLRELRKVCATAVETVGGLALALLTRDGTPERDAQLWLPDEDDVDAIADPLASLASRRLPEGAENPDLADLVRLGLGLLAYYMKQRALAASLVQYYAPAEEPEAEPVPA